MWRVSAWRETGDVPHATCVAHRGVHQSDAFDVGYVKHHDGSVCIYAAHSLAVDRYCYTFDVGMLLVHCVDITVRHESNKTEIRL